MATEKLLSMKLVRISMKTSALLNTIFESMFTYSGFIQMLLSKKIWNSPIIRIFTWEDSQKNMKHSFVSAFTAHCHI